MILKHIPNIITITRLLLIAPFLYYLMLGEYQIAFYLFIIAGASDGVDGFLARRFNWSSQLGGFIDPLADKLLMISAFIVLTYLGKISIWLCSVIVGRDIIIMVGVGVAYLVLGDVEFHPTNISKTNTALQILLILMILFQMSYQQLPENLIFILSYCVMATTLLSLSGYVYTWGKKAALEKQ